MSAHGFGSDWAQLEAGTFRFRDPLNRERRFIPLRLDDAPIKGSLVQFSFVKGRGMLGIAVPVAPDRIAAPLSMDVNLRLKNPGSLNWREDEQWRSITTAIK